MFPEWEDFEWQPRLCAQMESAADPSKAPQGKDLMSSFTILTQEAMQIPWKNERIIDGHLRVLESMFPGFTKCLDWYYFTVAPFGVGLEMSIKGLDLRYRDVKLPGLKNFYLVGDTVEGWGCGMDGAVLSSVIVSDEITGLGEMEKILPQWLGPLE
jgi:phytoene dehydrogenase-like protein